MKTESKILILNCAAIACIVAGYAVACFNSEHRHVLVHEPSGLRERDAEATPTLTECAVPVDLQLPSALQLAINRLRHPGYSWCERCGRTWDVAQPHDTVEEGGVTAWTVITDTMSNSLINIHGVPHDGKPHTIYVTNGDSCFPLCEQCWRELKTPEARLPYYRLLVDEWCKDDTNAEAKWPSIEKAVMEGK
ncbi:MAG: hypothetical protein KGL39_02860 [Patescibacteria group bacterium]|nr:hypothetical protein [Patescibacteria group bacterium]